jgi:hypothetical protein
MAGTKTKVISLTEKATGIAFKLAADNIINFYAVNAGADSFITFIDKVSGKLRTMTVDEAVATINTAAAKTFAVTYVDGGVVYIHADRIVFIADLGTTRLISYYSEQAVLQQLIVSTSAAAINTAAGNTFAITMTGDNSVRYINCNLIGTISSKGILASGALSAIVAVAGTGYVTGDTIDLAGGTNTGAGELTVATTKPVSLATNAAGTGYAPGDTILTAGGTAATHATLTVTNTKAVSADVAVGGTGDLVDSAGVIVEGTTGTGTKFRASVTIVGNAIDSVQSITVAGNYTVNPTDIANEPVIYISGGAGGSVLTGAELSVVMGVLTATITTAGAYTVNSATFTQNTTSGAGTGATFNTVVYGVNTVTVSDPGEYTVLPANPVAQSATSGAGINATFTVTFGSVSSTGSEIIYDQKSGAFVPLIVDQDAGALQTTINAL